MGPEGSCFKASRINRAETTTSSILILARASTSRSNAASLAGSPAAPPAHGRRLGSGDSSGGMQNPDPIVTRRTPSPRDASSAWRPFSDLPQGGQILYLDGHVAWRPFSEMKIRYVPGDDEWF